MDLQDTLRCQKRTAQQAGDSMLAKIPEEGQIAHLRERRYVVTEVVADSLVDERQSVRSSPRKKYRRRNDRPWRTPATLAALSIRGASVQRSH